MVYFNKWLILDLLDMVWRIYDIHVHHKRYVGRNPLHGLLVKSISFLSFFHLCFKWLYMVIIVLHPFWCGVHSLANCYGSRYQTFSFKLMASIVCIL